MKKILKFGFVSSILAFAPVVTFAVAPPNNEGLSGVLYTINNLLAEVVPVLIALGVVYFIWGVVQYFIADNEEAKSTGKDRIIFGIIGLAVIVSLWGIVNLLADTFTRDADRTAATASNLIVQGGSESGCNTGQKLQGLMNYVTCIIGSSVIPLIFAIAVVMFIWGAVKFFIIGGGEEESRTQGKQFMLWGLVALAVMISVWGLVRILGDTFNIRTDVLPTYQPSGSSSSSGSRPTTSGGGFGDCWEYQEDGTAIRC